MLTKLVVRIFRDRHFLALPISGGAITEIDDLSDVSDVLIEDIASTLYHAKICGIKQLETCLTCDGNVLESDNLGIGSCQKCHMTQNMPDCKGKLMAKMLINGHEDEDASVLTFKTVVAYGDVLNTITGMDEIDPQTLLKAKPFNAKYNDYYVLTSISRN